MESAAIPGRGLIQTLVWLLAFATIASLVFLAIGTFALFGRATPDDLMAWWLD